MRALERRSRWRSAASGAVVLLLAIVIGILAGALAYFSEHLPVAVLRGGGAVGAGIPA